MQNLVYEWVDFSKINFPKFEPKYEWVTFSWKIGICISLLWNYVRHVPTKTKLEYPPVPIAYHNFTTSVPLLSYTISMQLMSLWSWLFSIYLKPPLTIFNADGRHNIDRGWLTCQSEIQILIHGQPLTLQGHTEDEVPPFSLKIIAREERVTTPDVESTSKKRKKVYDILPVFIRVSITMWLPYMITLRRAYFTSKKCKKQCLTIW